MTLGISKSYTPGSLDVANSTSYNTDISALFNAFSGLEAQTSTLGGLTITPTSNGTTTFKLTNAAGTELIRVDTTNSTLGVKSTGKIHLDTNGNTYIHEASADNFEVVVGGAIAFTCLASNDCALEATGKLYLDGGTETYIMESAADVLDIYVGGANVIKITEDTADTIAFTADVMTFNGAATWTPGSAIIPLSIVQASDADCINIKSNSTTYNALNIPECKYGAYINTDIAGGWGLSVYRNIDNAGAAALVVINDDHASCTQSTVTINNDGGGNALSITNGGTGNGLRVVTTGAAYSTYIEGNYAGYLAFLFNDGNNANRAGLAIQNGADNDAGANVHISVADGDGTQVGSCSSTSGTTTWATSSDFRLKEDIKGSSYGLNELMKLEVVDFKFKKYGTDCNGLVAQEVYKVYPFAVAKPDDEEKSWGIDYGRISPLIIKAVQELAIRVETLEKKGA